MAEENRTRERMPAWGLAILVIAALMLIGMVVVVLANRPGADRRATTLGGDCDLLAKVTVCEPSAPMVEYASAATGAIGAR